MRQPWQWRKNSETLPSCRDLTQEGPDEYFMYARFVRNKHCVIIISVLNRGK
jgi:hypothetical protein